MCLLISSFQSSVPSVSSAPPHHQLHQESRFVDQGSASFVSWLIGLIDPRRLFSSFSSRPSHLSSKSSAQEIFGEQERKHDVYVHCIVAGGGEGGGIFCLRRVLMVSNGGNFTLSPHSAALCRPHSAVAVVLHTWSDSNALFSPAPPPPPSLHMHVIQRIYDRGSLPPRRLMFLCLHSY